MRYALILFLAVLGVPALADELPAITDSGYTRCDVHLLARAWTLGTDADALGRLEQKVAAGQRAEVDAALDAIRPTITPTGFEVCPYYETGLGWDDADALAKVWGLGDASEAKARVEHKLIHHLDEGLMEAALSAREQFPADPPDPEVLYSQAFFDAGLDWCDAEVLGRLWKTDFYSAKIMMGKAIMNGESKALYPSLQKARKKYTKKACRI